MIGKCFFWICSVSMVCSVITGNTSKLASAVFDGCADSIELSLSLLGMMCLWCGVIEVLKEAGALRLLTRLLSPIISRLFPSASAHGVAIDEITSSVAANMLGVVGAATPFAVKAMEKLDSINDEPKCASDDMVTLSVLGSSSISLLPTTIIALRHSAGSLSPYSIIIPVWICSVLCTVFGMILSRLTARRKQ